MNEQVLEEARLHIAGFFKQRRLELKLTQQDVANRTGLARKTINAFERGLFWPVLKQYLQMCEALYLFPMLVPFESGHEFARMMRNNWTATKEKDMSIEDALALKNRKNFRPNIEN